MTKEELSQLRYLEREIEQKKQEIARLRERATAATQTLSPIPGAPVGSVGDKVGSCAAALADLARELDALTQAYWAEYLRLSRFIAQIGDSLTRQIFTLRYVRGYSWQKIAFAIGEHDESYARHKHTAYLKLAENSDSPAV